MNLADRTDGMRGLSIGLLAKQSSLFWCRFPVVQQFKSFILPNGVKWRDSTNLGSLLIDKHLNAQDFVVYVIHIEYSDVSFIIMNAWGRKCLVISVSIVHVGLQRIP